MKTSHHFLAVLLAVLLCLSLTACGDSSDDVTGDDWRASGVVAAEGTITHEGEGSVKVLVTVGPESGRSTATSQSRSFSTACPSP